MVAIQQVSLDRFIACLDKTCSCATRGWQPENKRVLIKSPLAASIFPQTKYNSKILFQQCEKAVNTAVLSFIVYLSRK